MRRTMVTKKELAMNNAAEKLNVIEHKGVVLNLSNTTLNYEDKRIELTKDDVKILRLLFESVGKEVHVDRIIGYLWEEENFIDENRINVNVIKLKRRLDEIGLDNYIQAGNNKRYMIN